MPVAGAIGLLRGPWKPGPVLIASLAGLALFALVTVRRYRPLIKSDGLVTVQETRRRLALEPADPANLDPKRVIIGMYRQGHRFSYVWITVEDTLDTHFYALSRRWPYRLGATFEGPNFADLSAALAEQQVDVLPQGDCADWAWHTKFGWLMRSDSE
ncbi:MAG: hypothetical protein JWQ12_1741 [Glaciihabitans sp.]|nr:hypothetical protein [Glaciihabitans sp.]